MSPLILNVEALTLSDQQFYQFCQDNPDLQFERNAQGELIVMSPTGGETGNRNLEIGYQLQSWSRQNSLGIAFDSSTGFKLPNGAERSPDAAWVTMAKWQSLKHQEQRGFVPLCPDFVIELRSPSDSLKRLQEKLQEYREQGTQLGWLIDRQQQRVEIYRPHQAVEILERPRQLSGETVLVGFTLDLTTIW